MRISLKKVFAVLIVLITFFSVNQWSILPLGGTFLIWVVQFLTVGIILWYKRKHFSPLNKKDYLIVKIYIIWMIIGIIRGIFVAEGYWEWKQWVVGSLTLSLPIFVYVFTNKDLLGYVLKIWVRFAIPFFFVLFCWVVTPDAYHFYLSPVLLLGCFLPVLDLRWSFLFVVMLLLMMFADFGARSQVIKALISLLISLAYLMRGFISAKILKFAHWGFYWLPAVLLYLGITGIFNPFEGMEGSSGKYVNEKKVNGKKEQEDLSQDTRTFIYVEVVSSAIEHDYVLFGRTPARGNDSVYFGSFTAEDLGTGKYERHNNEVCFPNIFTWLGLVGMLLYCMIYLKSSYLAVYKSNNIFMKLLGVFIAFRFLYGWIEDMNRFDIMNIALWMLISMGFSEQFRGMNNQEFKYWIRNIFR